MRGIKSPRFAFVGGSWGTKVILLADKLSITAPAVYGHRDPQYLRATQFGFLDVERELVQGLGLIEIQNQALLARRRRLPATRARPASPVKNQLNWIPLLLRRNNHRSYVGDVEGRGSCIEL